MPLSIYGYEQGVERYVTVLELEKEALAQKLEVMERGAIKVTERVDGVEKEVATGMEKAKEEVKKDVKTEMLQREERSCNIVIYGLEETTEDKADKWREGKTEATKRVFISHDLTWQQREEVKKVKAALQTE